MAELLCNLGKGVWSLEASAALSPGHLTCLGSCLRPLLTGGPSEPGLTWKEGRHWLMVFKVPSSPQLFGLLIQGQSVQRCCIRPFSLSFFFNADTIHLFLKPFP